MEEYKVTVSDAGTKRWSQNGLQHRLGGPAIEYANGDKSWYEKGKIHRIGGPAFEGSNGFKAWYQDNKLHRLDGPAIERVDGSKAWYQNHERHREDGPAIESANGSKSWYINGKKMTEREFLNRDSVVIIIDGVTARISKESVKSIKECIIDVGIEDKCMTCKNNSRLGAGNFFPLCMVTGFKIVNPVFECKYYDEELK